jgi:hypothetical protein
MNYAANTRFVVLTDDAIFGSVHEILMLDGVCRVQAISGSMRIDVEVSGVDEKTFANAQGRIAEGSNVVDLRNGRTCSAPSSKPKQP